eukprot:scaffold186787_cov37-Tisochrysis_lutea.AAC.1
MKYRLSEISDNRQQYRRSGKRPERERRVSSRTQVTRRGVDGKDHAFFRSPCYVSDEWHTHFAQCDLPPPPLSSRTPPLLSHPGQV